jgi:MFS family permease
MAVASKAANTSQDKVVNNSWYVLGLLMLSYAVYTLDKSVVSVLIEPIKREFALNDSQVSLLSGMAATLPFALACIPLGLLADRVKRKWLMVSLMGAWSLATGMAGLAGSIGMLFASRMLVGALESGFTPTSMSILSDTFPKVRRAGAMGIFALGAPIGVFVAMAAGGYMAAHHGWRSAFFLAGVPGIVLALLIGLSVVEPRRGRYDPVAAVALPMPPVKDVLLNMWRNRALFHVTMGMTAGAVLLAIIATWTPSFLIRVHGIPLGKAGFASALLVGICGALGAASGGLWADRIGRTQSWRRLRVAILGNLAAVVFGLPAILLMPPTAVAMTLIGLMSFSAQFYMGTGYATATDRVAPNMRGTTVSVLLLLFNVVSYGLGSLISGAISDLTRDMAGARSIGIGMSFGCLTSLLAAWHFWRAMTLIRSQDAVSAT